MSRVEEVAPGEEVPVEEEEEEEVEEEEEPEEEEEVEDSAPEGKVPGEGTDKEDDEQLGAAGASTNDAPARAP